MAEENAPPPLTEQVTLEGGYTPPSLSEPVVLVPYGEAGAELPGAGLTAFAGGEWGRAKKRQRGAVAAWQAPPERSPRTRLRSGGPSPESRTHTLPWGILRRERAQTITPWPGALRPERSQYRLPWRPLRRMRTQSRASWDTAEDRLRPQYLLVYRHPPTRRRGLDAPSGRTRHRHRVRVELPFTEPPAKREHWRIPWGRGHRPLWDFHPDEPDPPPEPEPEPPYTPPAGDAVTLDLHCPLTGSADLWIGFDCPPTEIGRTITVDNQITVERHADDEPVAVQRVQLSTDIDSWTWDWQATLLGKPALQKLEHDANGPRAVRVTINGVEWIVLAEEYTEDRRWQRTRRSTSGRGRAAYLAGPYAPAASGTEANGRSAQQLALDALEFTDWTLQWEIPDWNVPGGTYSWQGKTPMERITRIAETAGAAVLSHPRDRTLIVRSRYPSSPWDWETATPDVTIQASQIRSASSRWEPQQHHNRIHVAGRENGVLVRVTREGSAGDLPADQVVDDLVTDVVAGRERGRVELSRAGDAAAVSVELPLLTSAGEYGLLEPGQLVEVVDRTQTWRGLVTAVQVDATRQSVSQSVEIERRFPDAT